MLLSFIPGGFSLPLPSVVWISINNYCNLECPDCFVKVTKVNKLDMPLSDFVQIIKNIQYQYWFKPQIVLFGMEPLLHPQIDKILDLLSIQKYKVTVRTNGMLPFEVYKKIINYPCIDKVMISIHNQNFKQIKDLGLIFREFNIKNKRKVRIYLTIQIDYINQLGLNLIDIINYFKDTGFRNIRFQHNVFKEKKYDSVYVDKLRKQIFSVKKYKYKIPIIFSPNISSKDLEKYYLLQDLNFFNKAKCHFPWLFTTVNIYGELSFIPRECSHKSNIPIFDLKKQKLSNIWNDKRIRILRASINKALLEKDNCLRCQFKAYYGLSSNIF